MKTKLVKEFECSHEEKVQKITSDEKPKNEI
jgi:hypothetical protein